MKTPGPLLDEAIAGAWQPGKGVKDSRPLFPGCRAARQAVLRST
jgi:hypothetical protein